MQAAQEDRADQVSTTAAVLGFGCKQLLTKYCPLVHVFRVFMGASHTLRQSDAGSYASRHNTAILYKPIYVPATRVAGCAGRHLRPGISGGSNVAITNDQLWLKLLTRFIRCMSNVPHPPLRQGASH
jgi:hypothetical protein